MPNIKSAKKRVSVIERRRKENRFIKSTMATMIKKFREAVKYDIAEAEKMLPEVIAYIDSAETKGVIHKNNASRKVSRLNTLLFKAKSAEAAKPETAEAKAEPAKEVKAEKAAEEKPAKKEKAETTKEPKAKKSAKKDAE